MRMTMKIGDLRLWAVLLSILSACNTPPLYESRARAYLEKQGVGKDVIK